MKWCVQNGAPFFKLLIWLFPSGWTDFIDNANVVNVCRPLPAFRSKIFSQFNPFPVPCFSLATKTIYPDMSSFWDHYALYELRWCCMYSVRTSQGDEFRCVDLVLEYQCPCGIGQCPGPVVAIELSRRSHPPNESNVEASGVPRGQVSPAYSWIDLIDARNSDLCPGPPFTIKAYASSSGLCDPLSHFIFRLSIVKHVWP